MSIVLTADQQAAYGEIITLLTTPRKELVINGFAGTGKTTLVNSFLHEWPQFVALSGGSFRDYEIHLTATTNKAADALSSATGLETATIHSLLGLRVKNTGFRKTELVDSGKEVPDGCLIIIDEASFIDEALLKTYKNCSTIEDIVAISSFDIKLIGEDQDKQLYNIIVSCDGESRNIVLQKRDDSKNNWIDNNFNFTK